MCCCCLLFEVCFEICVFGFVYCWVWWCCFLYIVSVVCICCVTLGGLLVRCVCVIDFVCDAGCCYLVVWFGFSDYLFGLLFLYCWLFSCLPACLGGLLWCVCCLWLFSLRIVDIADVNCVCCLLWLVWMLCGDCLYLLIVLLTFAYLVIIVWFIVSVLIWLVLWHYCLVGLFAVYIIELLCCFG